MSIRVSSEAIISAPFEETWNATLEKPGEEGKYGQTSTSKVGCLRLTLIIKPIDYNNHRIEAEALLPLGIVGDMSSTFTPVDNEQSRVQCDLNIMFRHRSNRWFLERIVKRFLGKRLQMLVEEMANSIKKEAEESYKKEK